MPYLLTKCTKPEGGSSVAGVLAAVEQKVKSVILLSVEGKEEKSYMGTIDNTNEYSKTGRYRGTPFKFGPSGCH